MRNIIFVHGGWHGGWCWREVADYLAAQGCRCWCPTLTGLGERSHLVDAVEGPDTHVQDIINVLQWNELTRVTLVGHSYGGMVITGVASLMPEQIDHMVYLDAFVPTTAAENPSNLSIGSRIRELQEAGEGHHHIPPNGFERWVSSPAKIAWLKKLTTPHPRSCFGQGVSVVSDPSEGPYTRTFILCEQHQPSPFVQFFERYGQDSRWRCVAMDCLHDAMIEQPELLAQHILESTND